MVQVAPADLGESHDEWGEEPVKKPSRFKGKFKSAVKKVLLSQGRTKKEKKTFWGHVRIVLRHVSKHLQFNIWNHTIKVIGERFGASVRGFMQFIRTLFWLNFTLAIVWVVVVQISQLTAFVQSDVDAGKFLVGLFTGTGLERSWFFFSGYGAYSMPGNLTENATSGLEVQFEKPAGLGLNIPESVVTTDVWYLGLAVFSMAYSLYFALYAILEQFGRQHDPSFGHSTYEAGRCVFDAWDFALTDKQAAADNLAKIGGSLKVLRDVSAEKALAADRTWKACGEYYLRKFIGLTLSLSLIIGSAIFLGYVLSNSDAVQKQAVEAAPALGPFAEFLFPVALAVINGGVPFFCKIFVKIEKWDSATEVSQLILRVWVTKLMLLIITFGQSYAKVGDPEVIRERYIAGDFSLEQAELYLCKEDFLGMLLWKMAITDIVSQVLTHSVALRLLYAYKSSVASSAKKLTVLRQSMKVAAFCKEVGLPFGNDEEKEASTKICEEFVADEQNDVELEDTDDKEWVCEDAISKYDENEEHRSAGSNSGHGEGRGIGSDSVHGLGKGGKRQLVVESSDEDDFDFDDDDADQVSESQPLTAMPTVGDDAESALDKHYNFGGYSSTNDCLDYYNLAKDKAEQKCKTEFDVPTNIINLMYQQCLIWSGFACAPFLFSLGLVGFTLQFFVQRGALMVRSKAPKSATVGSLYYRFLLGTWCFALVPNVFLVIAGPSQYCGPFSVASNSSLPPTSSVYMTFHFWFLKSESTSSPTLQYWYSTISFFAFNAVVMLGCVCCCCVSGVFYREEGNQLRRMRTKANHLVHTLENDRNRTMKKVKEWCEEDGGDEPHVIPGLADETVFFIQPLSRPASNKSALKVPTNEDGSGMDAEIVSRFFMWRTGRAAPSEESSKEVMTMAHPYSEIVFEDSEDEDQDFDH